MRAGGAGRYGADLVAGLTRLGHDLRIVGPDGRLRPTPFTPWGRAAVASAARRSGAHLVHGLHLEVAAVRVPSVVTIHDVVPLDVPAAMPSAFRRAVYRRVLDQALRRAALVVAPSDATAARLAAHGADPRRLAVVPLAVGAAFRPLSGDERDAARRRFAGGRPYVAAAAGARAHKNPAVLGAAAALVATGTGVPVIATGAGGPGHPGAVRYAGRLSDDDLARFYGGADVLVVASLVEGFGLPAVEALACGVPVVAGPGLGALPLVRDGVVVVDVGDPEAVAGAIGDLLDDGRRRAALGTAGAAAAASLTVERMAGATVDVYRRVLGDGPFPSSASR